MYIKDTQSDNEEREQWKRIAADLEHINTM